MSRSNIFPYLINNFTRTLNEEWFFSYIFFNLKITCSLEQYITQRVMFHIDGFFSKCEQICSFLRISLQLPENWCCVGLPENMCCVGLQDFRYLSANTAQKMKLFIEDFFIKCDQIRRFLRIWSHLPKKSLMENFSFRAVQPPVLKF